MTDWSSVAPPSENREIEQQRRRVLELRAQIPQRREQRDTAAARVTQLEREDRERMAQAMARGKDTNPDVEQVEKARADAAGAVRAFEALVLAIETSEQQLHAAVLKARDSWTKQAQHAVVEARQEAREAFAAFEAAFKRHREAQAIEVWLRPEAGLDQGHPPRGGVLGPAPGSAKVTANAAPVDLTVVFSWLTQVLAEPEPPKPPPTRPLQPVALG